MMSNYNNSLDNDYRIKRYIKMSLNMGYNNQNAPVPAAS